MITFVLINILCILILVAYFLKSFSKYGKSLFMDVTKLYYLVIIIFPLILMIVNVVYLYLMYPNFIIIGLYPIFGPLSYWLFQYYDKHLSKKKYILLSQLKEDIVTYTSEYDLNIKSSDIRIRILPKNRIDIIVNTKTGYSEELLEEALNNFEHYLHSKKEYKNFTFNFYIDEKKK